MILKKLAHLLPNEIFIATSRNRCYMPTHSYDHPLFGKVTYRTKNAEWKFGDAIEFIDGFDISSIEDVRIPQLANVPGSNKGRLPFHKNGHAQLVKVFEKVEELGLMHYVKMCAGSLNYRLRKPISGKLSKLPSNHAFGIAIDLNSNDGKLGASIAPLAPVFLDYGFKWGKDFKDPMHFEIEEFLVSPGEISKELLALGDLYR